MLLPILPPPPPSFPPEKSNHQPLFTKSLAYTHPHTRSITPVLRNYNSAGVCQLLNQDTVQSIRLFGHFLFMGQLENKGLVMELSHDQDRSSLRGRDFQAWRLGRCTWSQIQGLTGQDYNFHINIFIHPDRLTATVCLPWCGLCIENARLLVGFQIKLNERKSNQMREKEILLRPFTNCGSNVPAVTLIHLACSYILPDIWRILHIINHNIIFFYFFFFYLMKRKTGQLAPL